MRSAPVCLLAVAACGRVNFVERADAALAFGAPIAITALAAPGVTDDDPSLTADLRELYFNSARAGGTGGGDIWVATRATPDAPWNPPELVAALSSASSETGPSVSADGLALYFASTRPGGLGATDIWMATRSTRSSPWGTPVHVPELSSSGDDTAPSIHASGLVVVLESTRGAGDANLWIATRSTLASTWSAPQPLGTNTADHEGSPFLAADGRTLAFNAIRPGGNGAADLYISTRASDGDPFVTEAVLEVSDASNDEDPWLSDDGRFLVFASNRTGDVEIYEARR